MTAVVNGGLRRSSELQSNGLGQAARFSDVPPAIDIPVSGLDAEEAVEVNLEDHLDDPAELCQLLENEKASKNLWITISLAYAKQYQIDHAIQILNSGLSSLAKSGPKERLGLLACLAWLDLLKSRQAPRVATEGQAAADTKTKDHYLREATASINDAMRINPGFPPLFLTRGVLNLLRASLQSSTKTGTAAEAERLDLLRQALKSFEDASRASDGRNMMAVMGRARTLYLLQQYPLALQAYQEVLSKMPSLTDPDPRIGIGCCLWQLKHHERAMAAWERALAVNPDSKAAHALLGVYYLRESAKYPASDPQFNILYKKAMIEHTKKAYTIDKNFPLSCAVFASYFLLTGRFDTVEPLARKAIEQTDINAIASDGWYLLGRKEHNNGDMQKATDCYNRADQARGGGEKGYWPAKFGGIQTIAQMGDLTSARLKLENSAQAGKSIEASTLLGCILAEEVFAAQRASSREDKREEAKRAVSLLEFVRKTWKDEKTRTKPDESVLLYLARLYESENPVESMKCLQLVESMQLDKIPDEEKPEYREDDPTYVSQLREHLPPQLLNNMACFFYTSESYTLAQETFQIALNACVKLSERQEAEKRAAEENQMDVDDLDTSDTDALVTTISYNLARTYEALGLKDEAIKVYEGLLARHSDYTDASARLAFMALETNPRDEGPRKITSVYTNDYSNTEVRAIWGWYLHGSKKKTQAINEDAENRHYKHTLQGYDKHDQYSLTGMGNVHLMIARDMPRNTDAEREKRSKMYQKAYEFFDKALQLDPKNAYAAQGIAIALCDDKKAYSEAVQILTKVKDTIRDASIYINLGHVNAELRQWQRSIDAYEVALSKVSQSDHAQLYACLSRVWLMKGKVERSLPSLNSALDFMQRALATQPDSPHLQFNVAFIQFQVALLVTQQKEAERTLEGVNSASQGLEESIVTFEEVAKVKAPPYPRSALEQRATMGKNTMRRQLERAREAQTKYETENADKLRVAKEKREQELKKREEQLRQRREAEEERARKIAEERQKIIERTEQMAEQIRAEAAARDAADYTEDEETGERVRRVKGRKGGRGPTGEGKKRKKRDEDADGFIDDENDVFGSERSAGRTPLSGGSDDDEGDGAAGAADGEGKERRKKEKPPKKKRRLERKAPPKEKKGKFKSAAVVVDSDEDEPPAPTPGEDLAPTPDRGGPDDEVMRDDDGDDEEVEVRQTARQRKQLRTIADEDEDEDEDVADGGVSTSNVDVGLAQQALAIAEGSDEE